MLHGMQIARMGLRPSQWLPLQLLRQECTQNSFLTTSSEKRGVDFRWGEEKIRGVNIGGWLVLEP
jgi:hypothetical protein